MVTAGRAVIVYFVYFGNIFSNWENLDKLLIRKENLAITVFFRISKTRMFSSNNPAGATPWVEAVCRTLQLRCRAESVMQ
jgi:hypothetical protein